MRMDEPEDVLRQALRSKADEARIDLAPGDIAHGAARSRRVARRRALVTIAAAAVVAVVVPTAVLLRPTGEEPSPAPSPSVSGSSGPTPTPSPTAASSGLATVPRGPRPHVAYLLDGTVHQPDGSTQRLPVKATDVVSLAPYHGGWIVLDTMGGLTQYDNTGRVVRQGGSDSALAVSADQMQTAFLLQGHLRLGISSGMGNGETDIAVGDTAHLIGFLGDRVAYSVSGQVRTVDGTGKVTVLPGVRLSDGASAEGDLLAGRTDNGGTAVVSASSGRVLWTDPRWFPGTFSPDGRYLVAYQSATGGEFETVGILDARTGALVAQNRLDGVQALPAVPPVAWDSDDSLLIPYRGGSEWALLRLGTDGTMTRATPVLTGSPYTDLLVFPGRP